MLLIESYPYVFLDTSIWTRARRDLLQLVSLKYHQHSVRGRVVHDTHALYQVFDEDVFRTDASRYIACQEPEDWK